MKHYKIIKECFDRFLEGKEHNSGLYNFLYSLRSQFAQAAQKVYDNWNQDNEDEDELNGGGICHLIADEITHVIYDNSKGIGVEATTIQAACGENHIWVATKLSETNEYDETETEVFHVDIPYSRYEEGGGYTWRKLPDVIFDEDDIYISRGSEDEYPGEDDYY